MEATEEQGEWNEQAEGGNPIWVWFGLDVSKESFTAARFQGLTQETSRPKEKSFPLDKKGAADFLKWRKSFGNSILTDAVAMEATGAYTGKLCRLLLAAAPDLRVSVCNPFATSLYTKSFTPHKSDGTDAVYIARYACSHQPRQWRMPDPDQAHLRALEDQRRKFVELRTKLSNRGETIEFKDVAKFNQDMIEKLNQKIDQIEAVMKKIIKSRQDIADEIALLDTVPGIGFTSAAAIYAMLGSLKQYTRKELSALSGVCPAIAQSGKSLKKSRIDKRGPSYLRQILYCDSRWATKIPSVKALKDRLDAQENSSKMRSRCACMRKMLLVCRAVVVSGKPFDKKYNQENSLQVSEEKSEKKSEIAVQTA
ncbi:MAG: transposase [Lentisphaeria bacterium]|nr:transposase [Lentisphaeria bacterium]